MFTIHILFATDINTSDTSLSPINIKFRVDKSGKHLAIDYSTGGRVKTTTSAASTCSKIFLQLVRFSTVPSNRKLSKFELHAPLTTTSTIINVFICYFSKDLSARPPTRSSLNPSKTTWTRIEIFSICCTGIRKKILRIPLVSLKVFRQLFLQTNCLHNNKFHTSH